MHWADGRPQSKLSLASCSVWRSLEATRTLGSQSHRSEAVRAQIEHFNKLNFNLSSAISGVDQVDWPLCSINDAHCNGALTQSN